MLLLLLFIIFSHVVSPLVKLRARDCSQLLMSFLTGEPSIYQRTRQYKGSPRDMNEKPYIHCYWCPELRFLQKYEKNSNVKNFKTQRGKKRKKKIIINDFIVIIITKIW